MFAVILKKTRRIPLLFSRDRENAAEILAENSS